MTYRYDEPVRSEDGVLFRVHNHAQQSFLFKVEKSVLEQLYATRLGKRNPIDPTDRGYPSQHVFRHVDDQRPFDVVDAYNHHRELIHHAAVELIAAKASGDPIMIPLERLNQSA